MSTPQMLTALAAITGVLQIRGEQIGARRQTYIWKPLTTGLIAVAALTISPVVDQGYRGFVLSGLLFSLLGDILLMLPRDRFLAGMLSFLVAHVCYIFACTGLGGWATDLRLLLPFLVGSGSVVALIWPRLGRLRLPVMLYISAIAVMGWQAVGLHQTTGRSLISIGAVLFVLSDAALALDRFWHRIPLRAPLVLGAYYTAQALIAWSVRL